MSKTNIRILFSAFFATSMAATALLALAEADARTPTHVAKKAAEKKKAADNPQEAAKDAEPATRPVHYEELEGQAGKEIIVETTMNTIRRGILKKYTNPGLTMTIRQTNGSEFELSVPREVVRSIRMIDAPPAAVVVPATPDPARPGSAQKN